VPWIVFSIPSAAFFQQQLLAVAVIAVLGVVGMLTRNKTAASLASTILLGLIVWGKVASDLYHLSGMDSALLLLEFMVVILLMEASNAVISFDWAYGSIREKPDELSVEARQRLISWVQEQFLGLGRLIGAAFGLSLGLLVVGDLLSVSFKEIAISGALVVVAVVVLVILLIYGREPEDREKKQV
jgi:hypothetical protein